MVFGGRVLSPLNLKFERMAPDGFRNWNMRRPCHTGAPLFDELPLGTDRESLKARLEAAINSTLILRVYPGMRGDHIIELMDRGVRNFVLELYDTGTANLRDSPYSLRRALAGRPGEGRALLLHLPAGRDRGPLPLRHGATSCGAKGPSPWDRSPPSRPGRSWSCARPSRTPRRRCGARMEQGNADACL